MNRTKPWPEGGVPRLIEPRVVYNFKATALLNYRPNGIATRVLMHTVRCGFDGIHYGIKRTSRLLSKQATPWTETRKKWGESAALFCNKPVFRETHRQERREKKTGKPNVNQDNIVTSRRINRPEGSPLKTKSWNIAPRSAIILIVRAIGRIDHTNLICCKLK